MTGRHRQTNRFRANTSIILTLVMVLALGMGGWGVYHYLNGTSCGGPTRVLKVAAAPDIAPVVQAEVTRWVKSRTACLTVSVSAAEPADVAAAIAASKGATLTGIGEANGKVQVPDAWIPDSSTWLQRLRTASGGLVPASGTSLAQSPVVLAMPLPIAKSLGWPTKKLGWTDLLTQISANPNLHTGVVDPNRDAAGLSGLVAVSAAAQAAGPAAQQATVSALRALATGKSAVRSDLLGRFPRAADPAALAKGLSAAPLTEQAVMSYDARQPAVPLAAVYLTPAPLAMDYPYTVLPSAAAGVTGYASELRTALTGADFRSRLGGQGLRAPDGTYGAGFTAGAATPRGPLTAAPGSDPQVIDQVLSTWSAVTQSGRMLSIIDVSGSMLTKVPSAGNLTREQVTVKAAGAGLSLLDDTWSVGLWVFSTNLVGRVPYRQLTPIVPLAGKRAALAGLLSQVAPKKNGDTGLYDTVLAGYKTVQAGWDPNRSNSLLVFTDGMNDNPGGLTLPALSAALQKIVDPKKPINVIMLGIGTEVSKPELTAITQAAGGGGVFIASDPNSIGQIFLKAIALRPRTGG